MRKRKVMCGALWRSGEEKGSEKRRKGESRGRAKGGSVMSCGGVKKRKETKREG